MTDNVDRIIARTLASNHHAGLHHTPHAETDAEPDPGPTLEERIAKLEHVLAGVIAHHDRDEHDYEIRLKRHWDEILITRDTVNAYRHKVDRLNHLHGYALNSKE